ncbi:hypothetical protein INT48_000450 [Thamnidium elegans]|uniref:Uncharacterized protein n=1 Tax=Thamnidium elegans TaxID=101142 RepID=A0A8H7VSR3_9FUNG|nr:hypothetical protein INT48_000450 [Thamnidium elegans]
MNPSWTGINEWEYLSILTNVFRLWLDFDDVESAKSLKQELQCFNTKKIQDIPPERVRDLQKSFAYQSELEAKLSEWDSSNYFMNKALDIDPALLQNNGYEIKCDYLYLAFLNTAFALEGSSSKSSVELFEWITLSFNRLLDWKSGVPTSLESYFRDLVLKVCIKDDKLLNEAQVTKVLQVLEKSVPEQEKKKLGYFMARVFVISKLLLVEAKDIKQRLLQDDYFEAVEKIPIPQEDNDLTNLNIIIKKICSTQLVSISKIMEGLDLLTQRAKGVSESKDGRIRMFKIKVLSDMVLTLEDPTNFNPDVLRLALDDIFLVKDEMEFITLGVIQMILCKTGDNFYDKKMYSVALPWYRYTMSIILSPSTDNNNIIALASKLSLCYEHLNDFNAAFDHMKQGLDSPSETISATAEDYLLLLKFSFAQDQIEQKIGNCACVIQYFYEYGREASVAKDILQYTLESIEKESSVEYRKDHVHYIVSIMRAVIHIKTTVYERLADDGRLRAQDLHFQSIISYFNDVLRIVNEIGKDINEKPHCIRSSDIQWMTQTVYNLGLFCFNVGRNSEGRSFFQLIENISRSFTSEFLKSFTSEQIKIFKLLATCFGGLDNNRHSNQYYEDILNGLDTPIQETTDPSFYHVMRSLKLNLCVRLGLFDRATDIFANHCRLPDCPFPILEHMADTNCPLEYAYNTLKNLHTKLIDRNVHEYSKWTRIFVSTTISRKIRKDVYECINTVIDQQIYKDTNYPQNEIYYLIVVTWNEGVTSNFDTSEGYDWYRLSFTFLSVYQVTAKKNELENNMRIAYNIIKK